MMQNTLARLQSEGLSRRIPWLITEYGYSAFAGEAEMTWPGALLNAEVAAQFLTLGGSAAYLYGYEPNVPIHEVQDCPTWGNLALLLSSGDHPPQPLAPYYAIQLVTRQWAQPDTAQPQAVYQATSSLRGRSGLPLVTAYAVHRPDGQWAVLLLNKDPKRAHPITVLFQRGQMPPRAFAAPTAFYQYSAAQYAWRRERARGHPSLNLPPSYRVQGGSTVTLPPFSLSVLRGPIGGPP